ncbi:MAG: hypothetical protein L3J09_12825 [Flavobacteriaceae bacterium]|nr:hypothetical protein [Flavobacteriaceae bacterium]
MKLLKITILVLFVTFLSNGQDLTPEVEAINTHLTTVNNGKKEFIQTISVIDPTVVNITVEAIDSKGNSSTKSYIINPADIKKNGVKKVVKKNLIYIEVPTNQKLIKLTTDNEKVSYVNSLKVYASDINNARELVSKIKEAIPKAQQLVDQRISFTTYQECINWLENNIGDVSSPSWDYSQSLKENTSYPGSIEFNKEIISSKSTENTAYLFNLLLLNPKTVSFKINGDLFSIYVETNKAVKTIKYFEDGIQKNYTSKLTIACSDIEQARDLRKVLKTIIPLAEELFNNSITLITSNSIGITKLNNLTGSLSINGSSFKQRFTGECIIDYTKEYDKGDDTEISDFNFSLNDINKNNINYNSKGAFLYVDIFTKSGEPFIKHITNGEDVKYEKMIRFFVPSIENAILLKQTLKGLIALCTGEEDTENEDLVINNSNSNLDNQVVNNQPKPSNKKSLYNFNNITVEEPQFMGKIFYVNNNEPMDLEETVYYIKQGASVGRKITGIGKVNAIFMIDGVSSPIKIQAQDKLYFICNYGGNNYLPSKIIKLLKLSPKKRTREYIVSSSSNASGDTENNKFSFIKFKAKKYGNESYIIEFANLTPGEYGFSIGGEDSGKEMYMFSIIE